MPAFLSPSPLLSRRPHLTLRPSLRCPTLPSPLSTPPARVVTMTATQPASASENPTDAPSAPPTLDRVVCKFGGSSLADSARLLEVTKLVKMQIQRSNKMPVVVLSAMGPSTNELLHAGDRALSMGIVDTSTIRMRAYEACDNLNLSKDVLVDPLLHNIDELLVGVKFLKELSPRTKDYLVSFGERLSVRIFAAHLRQNEGLPAEHVDAFDAGFLSNSNFTRADLQTETYDNIKAYFHNCIRDDHLAVVTGFIAKDEQGNITTLGRGGSDLTAAVLGAALQTTEVQVWKDVDGILSSDPRIVEHTLPIPSISFDQAAEMAFFGAKILHPIAMQPAMKANIPVRVKNSYNPLHPGTVIVRNKIFDEQKPVLAISIKKNVQIVDVVSTRMLGASGFLAEVFKAFAQHGVSVDMIATSEVSISMTLDNNICDEGTLMRLKHDLDAFALVTFSQRNKAIISLVGDSSRSSNVVGRAVSALDKAGVRVLMISQGASKNNISVTIEGDQAKTAVREVHNEFFPVKSPAP